MSLIKKIEFKNLGDARGDLVSIEANKNIPFSVNRVYYLVNTQVGKSRGFHAHKKLQQVLICLKGRCTVTLDDGKSREEVVLNSFSEGILIDSLIWREMHDFTDDCVLLVIANEYYDESDYIRSYTHFLEEIGSEHNT